MITNPNRPAEAMTKREEFVKAALQGILSNPAITTTIREHEGVRFNALIEKAVEMADKTLAELGDPNENNS